MGNFLSNGPSTTTEGDQSSHVLAREVVYGVMAALSFLLNSLFCVVMMRRPTVMKRPHNILLFTLALADLLTAIFVPLTPGYVIRVSSFPVPHGLAGKIFCLVLGSRYALFTFARVSILQVTCLAIERWYSVFRPISYKHHFTRTRLYLYILAIWLCTCLLQTNKFLEWKLSAGKCSSVKAMYGVHGTRAIIITNSLIGFYIPCVIVWASFAHIALLFKTSPIERCYDEGRRAQQKALLLMCAVTSIVLSLCWLQAQTIYILSPFGITKIGSPLHRTGGILAMSNSCVNPLIYWVTNKEYRDGLFQLCRCRSNSVGVNTTHLRRLGRVGERSCGTDVHRSVKEVAQSNHSD